MGPSLLPWRAVCAVRPVALGGVTDVCVGVRAGGQLYVGLSNGHILRQAVEGAVPRMLIKARPRGLRVPGIAR
jgi:hypothetical protein